MNAASSVLPMVRSHPLQLFKALSFPFTEFFAFLLTGAMGAIFHSPPVNNKASPYVCMCVCCLCIAGAGVGSLARPLTANRHTPLRSSRAVDCSQSPSPGPPGRRPGLVYVPCLGSLSVQPRTAGKTMIGPSRFLGAAPARDQAGFRWMSAVVGHGCDAI